MPIARLSGRLNTLIAYACPMHRWIRSAAGGTSQRLNAGPAMIRSRDRRPAIDHPAGRVTRRAAAPLTRLQCRHRGTPSRFVPNWNREGNMADPREVYMARKDRWLPRAVATLVVGGLFVVGLLSSIAYVPAGHVGVLTLFGQVTGEELSAQLGPRGILVENILLRDVQLPAMLKSSIEAKQQAEQDALRMTFVLQKEKQEAERKRIEAQGIADFQRIVAQGISAQLLEWKGIEATEKLANSPNAKVIMIGSARTGLPLIFEPK